MTVAATQDETGPVEPIFRWIGRTLGGSVTDAVLDSGGNRCVGWRLKLKTGDGTLRPLFLRYQAFDSPEGGPYVVNREAELYAALSDTAVPLPHFVCANPEMGVLVTEIAGGDADYRRLPDEAQKAQLADDLMQAVATLHTVDPRDLSLPSFGTPRTMAEAVTAEIDTWEAMYRASGRTDALIEFGLAWLRDRLPDVQDPPVIVHGDTGPGNFMFDDRGLTCVIDWELAHLGDPMEDLAWLSFRGLLQPLPDFAARVRAYAMAGGHRVDPARIRYHQAFVAWRVAIIRHNNVSGEMGGSIVTRALSRRIMVEAITLAEGLPLPAFTPLRDAPDDDTALFDRILHAMKDTIVPRSTDPEAIRITKEAARAMKFLRRKQLIGAAIEAAECTALAEVLNHPVATSAAGQAELADALRSGTVPQHEALPWAQRHAAHHAQLAADTMGAIATRRLPEIEGYQS